MGTLEDGTLGDPACSALDVALAEYRWAKDRLEVLFFYAGYWQAIVASAAAGGGGRSAQKGGAAHARGAGGGGLLGDRE